MKRSTRFVAVATAAVLGMASTVLSQEPLDLRTAGAGMRRNQEELRQFNWQSKITFLVYGAERRTDVYQVAYNEDGWLQRTQIDTKVADGKVRGQDGKKLKKKQLEAARKFVIEAKSQLDGYLSPLFAEKAVTTATSTVEGEDLILTSQNVVHPGDTVKIVLSKTTRLPRNMHAKATVDGSPMELGVTFEVLDFGPYHPARSVTTTSWSGIPVSIITENSNYSE